MRILLLSQWYPPEPQKVVSDLAESLRDCGHEVTVLTGFPNYPSGKLYAGYQIQLLSRERWNGIDLLRVPLYPDHSRSRIKRTLNYLSFAFAAATIGPFVVPKTDLIYVIHPPVTVGLPAWILSKRLGVPFVYEIQDMWPETLTATGMVSNLRVLGLVGWFAKWIYKRATAIRVISPGFKRNLLSKQVSESKIHVVSNWVDTEMYRPVCANPELAAKLNLNGKFNIVFAGTMGMAQGLEHVIRAAKKVEDLLEVQIVFVGDGAALDDLQKLAVELAVTNVRFVARQPSEMMSEVFALADVLLLHLKDDPLFEITIPHKTFAYLASGKPILAAVRGDAADVVSQAKAGLTCSPCSADDLSQAIRTFVAMPSGERLEMGQRGRKVALEHYSREKLTRDISEMLNELQTAPTVDTAETRLKGNSRRAA